MVSDTESLILQAWEIFDDFAVHDNLPPAATDYLQSVFFAGAVAAFALLEYGKAAGMNVGGTREGRAHRIGQELRDYAAAQEALGDEAPPG